MNEPGGITERATGLNASESHHSALPVDSVGGRVLSIYFSAPFARRLELLRYAADLRALGHETTSTWLWAETRQVEDDGVTLAGHPGALRMLALMDCGDIADADTVIVFTEPPGVPIRGGYLWEAGYALGRGKRLVMVGPRRVLFDWHPDVWHFDTWQECMEWLGGE